MDFHDTEDGQDGADPARLFPGGLSAVFLRSPARPRVGHVHPE